MVFELNGLTIGLAILAIILIVIIVPRLKGRVAVQDEQRSRMVDGERETEESEEEKAEEEEEKDYRAEAEIPNSIEDLRQIIGQHSHDHAFDSYDAECMATVLLFISDRLDKILTRLEGESKIAHSTKA